MKPPARTPGPPLKEAHIICFAPNPWHDIWRNRQHIFSRLAKDNTVLYVDPKLHSLSALRRGKVSREELRAPRLQHESDGLWLYFHPAWAPRSARSGLRQLTRRLRWLALRRAMARLGLSRPITWVFQPLHAELVGTLGERLVVYHVVDEYAAFKFHSPEMQRHIAEGERRLVPRADLVIATSRALLKAKAPLNPNIALVLNGVDFAAYEKVRQANTPPPEDIAPLRRPIVGYVGHISVRLDLSLLAAIARQRPDWSLALVGSIWETGCEAESAVLRALPNVHLLGQKAPHQVPQYIHAFDAGLIPYHQGEEARNINPIKLYEYLAAGKPVVSIDIPALDGFRHVTRVADSPETFISELEAALNETEPAVITERHRLAAENTWERRVEQISTLVQAQLDNTH